MVVNGDTVADCVLSTFDALPKKAKPRQRDDGKHEWVPLSGIVLWRESDQAHHCVALGTGSRCLPSSKVSFVQGATLHDWHAEILALRGLNYFLLTECLELASSPAYTSPYLHRCEAATAQSPGLSQPFALREDWKLAMYTSEAPCGDASMEVLMRRIDNPTPWAVPASSPISTILPATTILAGRANFSLLGQTRRKPSRPDAPPTLSKSCSDKLALKQCTSLLSSLTALLIRPSSAYLDTLIMPTSQIVDEAVVRAWGRDGRMRSLIEAGTAQKWQEGYGFRPFKVASTQRHFEYARDAVEARILKSAEAMEQASGKLVASNLAALWTPRRSEVLIGGRLQGFTLAAAKGSSCVSRIGMWRLLREVAMRLGAVGGIGGILDARTYEDVKKLAALEERRRVKEDVKAAALTGWTVNAGDDKFMIEGEA